MFLLWDNIQPSWAEVGQWEIFRKIFGIWAGFWPVGNTEKKLGRL